MTSDVVTLLTQSGIPLVTPKDADYSTTLHSYTGTHDEARPNVVTLPDTAEQVATVVTQCIESNHPLVVRGGGHDMFGRFAAPNAVSIDLRRLDSVIVSEDKKNVRVGGGVKAAQVLEELEKHGLQAPVGSCGGVGHTSWCLIGGLGAYVHSYGLGADQIVGAKVVNAHGQLVEADEKLLKGLRGGGGSLAIVVELTVKAYPLQEIQAGLVMYESSDLEKSISTFFTVFNDLVESHQGNFPSKLYLMPFIHNFPGMGVTVTCAFVWNGLASDESAAWLDKVSSLATLLPGVPGPKESITASTPSKYLTLITSFLPPFVTGRTETASVTRFSPELVAILAKAGSRMPKGADTALNFHIVRKGSPSCSANFPDSVCPYRQANMYVEIFGFESKECSAAVTEAWARETQQAITASDVANKRLYMPLTAPERVNLQDVYGDKLAELMALKKEYDPQGILKNTVPKLFD